MATNVRFGSTELELDEANFCFFYPCRTASCDNDILVEDNAIDKFGVFYGTTDLLDDTDIA